MKIFFHHIPKTAGTTLIGYLNQRADIADIIKPNSFGVPPRDVREDDVRVHKDKIRTYNIIHGHFPVAHFNEDFSDYFRFTFIRNPLRRMVSLYNDWRSKSAESLKNAHPDDLIIHDISNSYDIVNFLKHRIYPITGLFDNAQVRLLSGAMEVDIVTSEHYKAAVKTLDQMDFVGITELFQSSLTHLFSRLGWEVPDTVLQSNKRKYNFDYELLDNATIVDAIKWDLQLYDYAMDRYNHFINARPEDIQNKSYQVDLYNNPTVRIDMSQGFDGIGWHVREGVGGEHIWRWTGPDLRSTLNMSITGSGSCKFQIGVISVIDQEILENANFYIGDTPLSWNLIGVVDGVQVIEGEIGGLDQNIEGPLIIEVPYVISHHDIDEQITDKRKKGLAITFIEFNAEG